MPRADGAVEFGFQASHFFLLIYLKIAALSQTCASWMWLCLQLDAEGNGLQRSEGDSHVGRLALGQVCIMFKSGSVLLQVTPTCSPASHPAARKGVRPGLLSRAIKLLKPLTHIPLLAVTP